MGEDSDAPRVVVNSGDPRRWIAAIVGGVLLGEALWAMLQLLIRDWATPALLNATGQGPTQNAAAFEPLPLLIAFVEACAAGIVLLLLMKWAQRQTRVIVTGRAVAATGTVSTASQKVVRPQAEALPVEPVAAPAPVIAPTPPMVVTANPVVAAPAMATPVISAPPTSTIPPQVPTAVPPATPMAPVAAASKPTQPPAPKKPKVVYYNSVGEPIEE
jgi:hypothetical protein